MGVATGIDLEALFAARVVMREGLADEPVYGMTPEAGLTVGFRYADGRLPRAPAQPLREGSRA